MFSGVQEETGVMKWVKKESLYGGALLLLKLQASTEAATRGVL